MGAAGYPLGMRGWSRRLRACLAALVALTATSCVTTGIDVIDDARDNCEQVCGAVVGCVILAPCLIAGTAGFVMGACTRCSEGDDPVDDLGAEETATRDELPPSPRVAGVGMRY